MLLVLPAEPILSKEALYGVCQGRRWNIFDMHVPEDALTELKKLHINVIDMGHMAADSLGHEYIFG